MCELEPIIKPGIKILFIGQNPHPKSCQNRVYFTSRRNFWKQLYEAGLTAEVLVGKEFKEGDDKKLLEFNLGITDLSHVAGGIFDDKAFTDTERKRLDTEISKAKPKVICFLGKKVYRIFTNKKRHFKFGYGYQGKQGDYELFVAMFPSNWGAHKEKVEILEKLKMFL